MNFEEWLEQNQYDVDFGNDTIDLMRTAYVGALKEAQQSIVDCDMYADDSIVKIEGMIRESE
jgi:hypothetical protein